MSTTKWTPELERQAGDAVTAQEVESLARRIGLSVTAVRLVGRQVRRARGDMQEQHRWTPEEDAALLRARTAEGARKVGLRVGVEPEVAVHRRQILRSKRGVSKPRHVWTEEEKQALRSAESASAAQEWARAHGLSEHTAKRRWYEYRWTPEKGL